LVNRQNKGEIMQDSKTKYVDTLEEDVDTLVEEIDTLEEEIEQLNSKIKSLNVRIDRHRDFETSQRELIDTLKSEMSDTQGYLENLALNLKLTTGERKCK
jgi:chaperonin cofactor prefoldin